MNLLQLFRFTLGLSWVYHGVFPKLVHVAPMEKAITATLVFSNDVSYWITKAAGMGELIFGLSILVLYRNVALIQLNIAVLIGLLAYVLVFIPSYLIEAFNPVTTNLSLIVISFGLMNELQRERKQVSEKN